MNESTRHAMLRCRYILINRKLFSEATNEINFNQCVEELTAALEEFPPRQKLRRTEREWDEIEEIGS